MAGPRNWTHGPHHAAQEYRRGLVVGGALGIACHGYIVAADPLVAVALLLCFPITGMVYLNQIAGSSGLRSTS